jgi:hypothetical protein
MNFRTFQHEGAVMTAIGARGCPAGHPRAHLFPHQKVRKEREP